MLNKSVDITIPMPWGQITGKTVGQDRNIPVLCVHGRSDNLETFSPLMPLLPHNYYYVLIDLPGHGKSAHADKGYILDLLWYAMCVKRVIDFFKWPKLYFLGHSLGGQIGFILAALYPKQILKLIIIDTLMYRHTPPPNTVTLLRDSIFDPILKLEQRSNFNEAPTYSFAEFITKMKEARMTEVNDEQIRAMAERNLIKVGFDRYKYSNDQRIKVLGPVYFTFDQLENVASQICCPTLVILGKNSRVTRPQDILNSSPLHRNRNTTFKIVEGDHDLHLTRPQEVANLLVPFMSQDTTSKL